MFLFLQFVEIGFCCFRSDNDCASKAAMTEHLRNVNDTNDPTTDNDFLIKVSNLHGLRTDPQKAPLFRLMAGTYFPTVYGKRRFRVMKTEKIISEFISISDEALVYLIIENNFEYWKMMSQELLKGKDISRNTAKTWTEQPKWTTDTKNDVVFYQKDWSVEGMKRFKEIQEEVVKDRLNKSVEHELLRSWQTEREENETRRSREGNIFPDNFEIPIFEI